MYSFVRADRVRGFENEGQEKRCEGQEEGIGEILEGGKFGKIFAHEARAASRRGKELAGGGKKTEWGMPTPCPPLTCGHMGICFLYITHITFQMNLLDVFIVI